MVEAWRFRFEPWAGTLRCVLGQDTLVSQCLTPPRCINRVRMGPGNPGKSWNFVLAFSRTGKSWKKATGPGKSWKSVKLE